MTYEVRLFGTIEKNLDSIRGNTAQLGELSDYARTFSTVKTEYSNPANYPDVDITVFSCTRDGIEDTLKTAAADVALSKLFTFANSFLADQDIQLQINDHWPTIASTFSFHTQVAYSGYILPGYVEWSETVDGDVYKFMLYLSDAVFRENYDKWEIRVIPPSPNIHDYDKDIPTIQQAISNYTHLQQIQEIETVRGSDSPTKIYPLELRWVDLYTKAEIKVTWVLVVFGERGLIYENQIRAIRDWLIDIYGTVPPFWVEIMPELETLSIVNILPLWDNTALSATGSIEYINSPTVDLSVFSEKLALRYGTAPAMDVITSTNYSTIYWKSLGFLAWPDEKSTLPRTFKDIYPDYALLTVNDININRLNVTTKNAVIRLEQALRICAVSVAEENLPSGFHYETEDFITFLVYMSDGILFRVATRMSYLNVVVG